MMIQADKMGIVTDVSEESGDDGEKEGVCVKQQNKVSEFVSRITCFKHKKCNLIFFHDIFLYITDFVKVHFSVPGALDCWKILYFKQSNSTADKSTYKVTLGKSEGIILCLIYFNYGLIK